MSMVKMRDLTGYKKGALWGRPLLYNLLSGLNGVS